MNKDQIITIDDLLNFEKRIRELLNKIDLKLSSSFPLETSEFLRTKEVRELLKISDDTLRSMRKMDTYLTPL